MTKQEFEKLGKREIIDLLILQAEDLDRMRTELECTRETDSRLKKKLDEKDAQIERLKNRLDEKDARILWLKAELGQVKDEAGTA